MGDTTALKVAIDLLHLPSRVSPLRSGPLPEGVVMLLRIVSGDEAATANGAYWSGRPPKIVHEAAAFFIEQILLFPGADSYRVLGADQNATAAELRRNMALLFRWLHPDVNQRGERSIFARRLTRAWEDVKTSERRAVYDKALHTVRNKRQNNKHPKIGSVSVKPLATTSRAKKNSGVGGYGHPGALWRFLTVLFGRGRWMDRI
jgi:hypothetical protein